MTNSGPVRVSGLDPGYWMCHRCATIYYIVDDQPAEVEEKVDYIDATTIGSPTTTYLVGSRETLLYCSLCR